jgi:DNA polymerase III subunit delta'
LASQQANRMYFKDIAGQQEVKERLVQSWSRQRVPHAMLFHGPEGNGKLALCIAFARFISCSARTETDACGACPSCVKFNKLEHPDLHFAFPVVKKGTSTPVSDDYIDVWRKYLLTAPYISLGGWMNSMGAENKQPIIYTDESDAITKKLSMKSYEGGYKFMIIYFPERMHEKGLNKLLKLIEEPPEQTLFFLVTENTELLLSTIISRCQMIHVPRISDADMLNTLINREGLDEKQAVDVAKIANGNYAAALDIIQQSEENRFNLENFIQVMRLAWKRELLEIKKWSDDMAKIGRENQKSFLSYGMRLIRENFVSNFNVPEISYMTSPESDFAVKFSRFINERNVIPMFEEFELAQRQIEQNTNARMVFFDMSLKMIMLLKS